MNGHRLHSCLRTTMVIDNKANNLAVLTTITDDLATITIATARFIRLPALLIIILYNYHIKAPFSFPCFSSGGRSN